MDLTMFKSKVFLILILGFVTMLSSLFIMNIRLQNRYDKIFKDYEIQMYKIQNNIY